MRITAPAIKKLLISAACIAAFGSYVVYERSIVTQKAADAARIERLLAEKRKERESAQENRCRTVDEALSIVSANGRADLAQPSGKVLPCKRILAEKCGYKVELIFELTKVQRFDVAESIKKIGDDCSDEYGFAEKYGLDAFRKHTELLDAAVEAALERAREEAREE